MVYGRAVLPRIAVAFAVLAAMVVVGGEPATAASAGEIKFVADVAVSEDVVDGEVEVQVIRTAGTDELEVTLDIAERTALVTDPADYTAPTSLTVTFAAGATLPDTETFTFGIKDDLDGEVPEILDLSISVVNNTDGTQPTISDGAATLTITDDGDNGVLTLSPIPATIGEEAPNATFTVVRSDGTEGVVSAELTTSGDSGRFSLDDSGLSWGIGIGGSKTASFNPTGNLVADGPENVDVSVGSIIGGATTPTVTPQRITILDNDAPGVLTLGSIPASIPEDAANISFTVTRSGGTAGSVTATFGTSGGAGRFSLSPSSLTWGAGDTGSKSVTFNPAGNAVDNPDVTVSVSIAATGATGVSAAGTPKSITIVDNDEPGTLRFTSSSAGFTETDGNVSKVITVERVGGTAGKLEATLSLVTGSAGGSDATVDTPKVTFLSGIGGTKNVVYTILGDNIPESSESFKLRLTGTAGTVISSPSEFAVTIADDDSAGTLKFSKASESVAETDGVQTKSVTVTRVGGNDGILKAAVSFVAGTAGSLDASLQTTSLTFGQNVTSQTVSYTIAGDNLPESSESFKLRLSGTAGTVISSPSDFAVTIVDNDAAGTLQFSQSSDSVTESDVPGVHSVTVTRTGGDDGVVTASVAIVTGSASTADVALQTTSVTFGQDDSSPKTVTFTVVGDNAVEGPESFKLRLTGASGTVIGSPRDVDITILDNDSRGVVGIVDMDYQGDEDNPGYVDIVLQRTGGNDGAISVVFKTKDKTASADLDYTALTRSIVWADQDSANKTVRVDLKSDLLSEGGEEFEVEITGAQVGGSSKTTVAIVDSDVPGSISFKLKTTQSQEADGEAIVIVERVNGSDGAVSVDYYTKDGSAKAGADFTGISLANRKTLTWLHGDADPKEIRIPLVNDAKSEGNETFKVQLTGLTGTAKQGSIFLATVKIRNNRPPKPVKDFVEVDRAVLTSIDLLKNDKDPDGTTLTYGALDTIIEGNSVVCAGSACAVDAADNFVGEIEFDYSVTDGIFTSSATATVQVGPACTIKGTDGDNTLTGTTGDDVICGLGGNDTINGKGGNDILAGGPGNDRIIAGSGSTEILGNSGTDTAEVAGSSGADSVLISDSKVVVGSDATSLRDVESVKVDAGGANDIVSVTPSATTAFDLNGGPGFDELNYNAGGLESLVIGKSTITASDRMPVKFSSFDVVVADESIILGTDGVDTQTIAGTDVDGNTVDLLGSGDNLTIHAYQLKGPVTVSDSGATGTDAVTILDFTGSSTHTLTPGVVLVDAERVNLSGIEKLTIMGRGGRDVFNITAGAAGFPYEIHLFGGTDNSSKDKFTINLGNRAFRIDKVARRIIVSGMPDIFYNDFDNGTVTSTVTGTKSIAVGYWMADTAGKVFAFGDALLLGDVPASPGSIVVKLVPSVTGNGYYGLDTNGVVAAVGDAKHLGNLNRAVLEPGERAATMAVAPDGKGYWIFTTRGRAQAFGSAKHFGDLVTLGIIPQGPVVDSVALPNGKGYYMVGSDGGVFSFGTAQFYGSMGGLALNSPVNGLVPDPDGKGYWLVAADGGVFAFNAGFVGSVPGALPPGASLNAPINGMVAYGNGYLMVATDGGIFNFSKLAFFGSLGNKVLANPIVAVAVLDV